MSRQFRQPMKEVPYDLFHSFKFCPLIYFAWCPYVSPLFQPMTITDMQQNGNGAGLCLLLFPPPVFSKAAMVNLSLKQERPFSLLFRKLHVEIRLFTERRIWHTLCSEGSYLETYKPVGRKKERADLKPDLLLEEVKEKSTLVQFINV